MNMTLLKTSDTIVIPGPEDERMSLSLSSRSDNSAAYKVGGDSKKETRLIMMRTNPDYVEFFFVVVVVNVVVVLIVEAVHKGLVVVDKSLSDTH